MINQKTYQLPVLFPRVPFFERDRAIGTRERLRLSFITSTVSPSSYPLQKTYSKGGLFNQGIK
jgi:hypothetical protein